VQKFILCKDFKLFNVLYKHLTPLNSQIDRRENEKHKNRRKRKTEAVPKGLGVVIASVTKQSIPFLSSVAHTGLLPALFLAVAMTDLLTFWTLSCKKFCGNPPVPTHSQKNLFAISIGKLYLCSCI
jgi:hypothetical protein